MNFNAMLNLCIIYLAQPYSCEMCGPLCSLKLYSNRFCIMLISASPLVVIGWINYVYSAFRYCNIIHYFVIVAITIVLRNRLSWHKWRTTTHADKGKYSNCKNFPNRSHILLYRSSYAMTFIKTMYAGKPEVV